MSASPHDTPEEAQDKLEDELDEQQQPADAEGGEFP